MRLTSKRLILAWLISAPFGYFGMGYLSNFYSTPFGFTLAALVLHFGMLLFLYLTLPMVNLRLQSKPFAMGIALALFIALSALVWTLFNMGTWKA